MPYVRQEARKHLDPTIDDLAVEIADVPGKLAYAVTRLTLEFIGNSAELGFNDSASFEDYANALGVLESVKLELYRVQVAAYEETKRLANGGVS